MASYMCIFSDVIPKELSSLPMTSLQIETKNDVKYLNVKLYDQKPSNCTQTV